jgi:hypothetical protein
MASIASKGTPVEGTPVKGTKVKGTKVAEASDDDDTSDGSEKSKETVEKDAKKWRRHVKELEAALALAKIDVRKPATL